jgi:hypothetical protein
MSKIDQIVEQVDKNKLSHWIDVDDAVIENWLEKDHLEDHNSPA